MIFKAILRCVRASKVCLLKLKQKEIKLEKHWSKSLLKLLHIVHLYIDSHHLLIRKYYSILAWPQLKS